jgi:hypothetical protein
LPAVDDVTVEDEFIAAVMAQKMDNLPYVGIVNAQVYVGEDNGSVVKFQIVQGFTKIRSLF